MREIFSWIFNRLTEPLGLPIEWYWELLILGVISLVAYKIAYRAVGSLYYSGDINGKFVGSLLHWIIRFIIFVIVWAVSCGVIWLVKFIFANWVIVVSVLGALLVITVTICIIVREVRKCGGVKCEK